MQSRRVAQRGGFYRAPTRGIPWCPLSPVLGAWASWTWGWSGAGFFTCASWTRAGADADALEAARRRQGGRRALASLHLGKHPDETFIGRIKKDFDWLGYYLRPDGLRLAAPTIRKFAVRQTGRIDRGVDARLPVGSFAVPSFAHKATPVASKSMGAK